MRNEPDNDVLDPRDVEYSRRELGRKLGLGRPVPVAVLLRIAREPDYRDRLFACAREASCLAPLVPPDDEEGAQEGTGPHPSSQLVLTALRDFWSWAGTGFGVVDAATYRRRIDACDRCPHYRPAPDRPVYALPTALAADPRVCDRCGCVMAFKARLYKQSCPSRHPDDPTRSRWGETYA